MSSKTEDEMVLRESVAQMLQVVESFPRMCRNLQEALPGFPASTPGAAPSSGAPEVDEDGVVPYTSVERVALHPDDARAALHRVHQLVERVRLASAELFSLERTWSFDRNQPPLDLDDENHDWCTSCLRIGKCEPRDRARYALTCRWCGDFKAAEGRSPSADLMLAHHEGRRITKAMIEQDHPTRRVRKARRRSAA